MTRLRPGAAVLLVVLALSLPSLTAGQAEAADATAMCQGQAATIVGGQAQWLRGTAGDDVVVTRGALEVDTGDGDDLVCVTGFLDDPDYSFVTVATGAGSDLVDTSASQNDVDTSLSQGSSVSPTAQPANTDSDVFIGGPMGDYVTDGGGGAADIRTGSGADGVDSFGNNSSLHVDLGRDSVSDGFVLHYAAGAEPRGPASVTGDSLDYLALRTTLPRGAPAGSWDVDNVASTMTRDAAPILSFTGFVHFSLGLGEAAVRFTGGPEPETLSARGLNNQVGPVTADLGAGDDGVSTEDIDIDVDGGPGRDRLQVEPVTYDVSGTGYYTDYLHVDLARGSIGFSDDTPPRRAVGFEDVWALDAVPITLAGTAGPNLLQVSNYACQVTVAGRGGDDTLGFTGYGSCRRGSIEHKRLIGGPGNDIISGSQGLDVLIGNVGDDAIDGRRGDDIINGGDGTDRANGGEGTDRCRQVESLLACER